MSQIETKGIFTKIKEFYLKDDGGKKTINIKRLMITFTVIFLSVFLPISLINSFSKEKDTSQINTSTSKFNKENIKNDGKQTTSKSKAMGGIRDHQEVHTSSRNNVRKPPLTKINYKAKQVLSANHVNEGKTLPIGVNLVGRLLSSIDTRTPDQAVKVILPYGGEHKGSGGSLPPNTILFGKAKYSGKGDKVAVNFNKGLLPNGQRIQLQAQALSSRDYSLGLTGKLHGNTTGRIAATLGLTMVSSVTSTLVKKEAIGQGYSITPKASLKNGLYNGVSEVANAEASRNAKKMGNNQDYVTVDAGSDLIVSLTGSYQSKQ